MGRALYTLAWRLAAPFVPIRLWWRGRREPGYRDAVGERFGRYATARVPGDEPTLWVHAVSVGETRAAAPLIARIEQSFPHCTILLTAMTAAGRETGRSLYGDRVRQVWLPYDLPSAVDAFLDRFAPRAGMLLETELWPNLVAGCEQRGIPVWLVNARMSGRSAAGYARVPSITRPMLRSLAGVAAQTTGDAARLESLGARNVAVTGSLKFDIDVPADLLERGRALRARIGSDRPAWLAASTRDGEEALIVDALQRTPRDDGSLLVLVPRHPQRFADVQALLAARGIRFATRSSGAAIDARTQVLVGDTMGEMLAYCAAVDVAFVGGSLLPLGGQNLIEPIAVGVPTLVGPHTFNFAEATERAIEAGAARRVGDASALLDQVRALLADGSARGAMRDAALAFRAAHQGAAARVWAFVAADVGRALARRPDVSPSAGD